MNIFAIIARSSSAHRYLPDVVPMGYGPPGVTTPGRAVPPHNFTTIPWRRIKKQCCTDSTFCLTLFTGLIIYAQVNASDLCIYLI